MHVRWTLVAALLALGLTLGTCTWHASSDHDDNHVTVRHRGKRAR